MCDPHHRSSLNSHLSEHTSTRWNTQHLRYTQSPSQKIYFEKINLPIFVVMMLTLTHRATMTGKTPSSDCTVLSWWQCSNDFIYMNTSESNGVREAAQKRQEQWMRERSVEAELNVVRSAQRELCSPGMEMHSRTDAGSSMNSANLSGFLDQPRAEVLLNTVTERMLGTPHSCHKRCSFHIWKN